MDFKNIKAVIFDADGTLLDSMDIWTEIGTRFLLSKGIKIEEELAREISTLSYEQAAEYYIKHFDSTATVEDIRNGVNALVQKFYFEEVVLKDGVKKFLEYLKSLNIKMCVATATDKFLIEAALKRNGILSYFKDVITCQEVGVGKNEPTIYEKALELLGTTKDDTLIFEDAHYAIVTAKKAGFKIIAVQDDAEKRHEAKIKELSDVYISSYNELF